MGEPKVELRPLDMDIIFDDNEEILNLSPTSSSSSGYSSMDINFPQNIPFNEVNMIAPNFFDWIDIKLFLRSVLPLSPTVLGGDMKSRLYITLPSPELEGCPIVNYFYTFCIDILPQVPIDPFPAKLVPMDIEDIISRLDIEIMGPVSTELPFELQIFKSEGSQWRIFCSFRPFICGVHTISVRIFGIGPSHITGSPFVKTFSRNYAQSRNTRPFVNINVQDIARIHDRPKYNPNWFNEYENEYEDELMKKPWGICSNTKTDEILVCDRADHEILVYSPDGILIFRFGKYGTEPGQFNRPTGIAYDATYDRLFITDKDNNRVQIFTPTGQFLATFGRRGLLSGQFMFPWGIAVSRDGQHIAISDSRNSRIQLFNSNCQYLRKFSIRCDNPILYKEVFNYPRGIAFSLNGDFIYVTDFNLHQVIRLDINLKEYQQLQTTIPMVRPQGIAVDDAGNILVCSSRQHSVKIFNPNGQFLFEIKSLADSPFDLPIDIAPLQAGFIAILDLNGRIRVF